MGGLLGLLGAVFGAVASLLRFVMNLWRMNKMTRDMPGPPGYPIIGNLLEVTGNPELLYDKLFALCKKYGPTGKIWVGPVLILVILDPDDIEVICKSLVFDKSFVYRALEPFTGKGLTVLNGKKWREHRKAISPSLHLDILVDFVDVFAAEGAMFAERLEKLADEGKAADVRSLCGYCANKAVCKSVMSLEDVGGEAEREEVVRTITPALELFVHRLFRPWLLNNWLFSWTKEYREAERLEKVQSTFIRNAIQRKVNEMKQRKQGAPTDRRPPRRRQAFLDHVLSSEEGAVLSHEELFQEVRTIVSTASGSSMDALAFVLYSLALRQDLQKKVYQEIMDIMGSDASREVTFSDLPHMEYLDRFIKEVMRYFTVVVILGRHCHEDLKLPSGYTAPRGCQIGMFLPATHHDPRYFPEPEKFDPERFSPENSRGRHPFCYIPFSAGTRNCIGQRYAMMFLKTVVATVVKKVRLLPAPDGEGPQRMEDVKLKMAVTLSARGGVVLRFQRRDLVSCK